MNNNYFKKKLQPIITIMEDEREEIEMWKHDINVNVIDIN